MMGLNTVALQFGLPGGPELIVILLLAVLLFGANKIPKLARSSGQAIGEFQKGRQQVEEELSDMQTEGEEEEDTDFVDTEPVTSTESSEK
jgi:sec-independent protein translocase protein TatA